MSWFNKHSVQAFFYNKIWVIRRAGEARRSLCVLLLCTMSSFWLWFVMICHHLRDCATCDSNRDNMTAGCWPLWCACFSSKFTDPYKEKPGLHPDSTTGWKSSNCSFWTWNFRHFLSQIFVRLHGVILHICGNGTENPWIQNLTGIVQYMFSRSVPPR